MTELRENIVGTAALIGYHTSLIWQCQSKKHRIICELPHTYAHHCITYYNHKIDYHKATKHLLRRD